MHHVALCWPEIGRFCRWCVLEFEPLQEALSSVVSSLLPPGPMGDHGFKDSLRMFMASRLSQHHQQALPDSQICQLACDAV